MSTKSIALFSIESLLSSFFKLFELSGKSIRLLFIFHSFSFSFTFYFFFFFFALLFSPSSTLLLPLLLSFCLQMLILINLNYCFFYCIINLYDSFLNNNIGIIVKFISFSCWTLRKYVKILRRHFYLLFVWNSLFLKYIFTQHDTVIR